MKFSPRRPGDRGNELDLPPRRPGESASRLLSGPRSLVNQKREPLGGKHVAGNGKHLVGRDLLDAAGRFGGGVAAAEAEEGLAEGEEEALAVVAGHV